MQADLRLTTLGKLFRVDIRISPSIGFGYCVPVAPGAGGGGGG